MPKKSSAKAAKKPARATAAKSRQPASAPKAARAAKSAAVAKAPIAMSSRGASSAGKYQQAGAPWWKQFLPR